MKRFNKIYVENKKLDEIFHKLYDNYSSDTIEKNILGLLVELGELANELRCFKYWSQKPPSDKDIILDEYADCLLLILYFLNITNISLEEEFPNVGNDDVVFQFKELFRITSTLDISLNKETIKLILSNLINLGRLLKFSTNDIIEGCIKKIERNKMRFETGF